MKWSVFFVVAASAACSGGTSGRSVAFDDFDQVASESLCAKIFECCDAAERMEELNLFLPVPETEAECVTSYLGLYLELLTRYRASIEAGTIVYRGDKAAECLDAIAAPGCSHFLDRHASCGETFEGTFENGSPCSYHDECVSQLCYGEPSVCAAFDEQGQACTTMCTSGLYCQYDAMGALTCQPAKANGAECLTGQSCMSGYCDGPTAAPGVCADRPPQCDGD